MQNIFHFELGMAFKDRPKTFQVITLVLFAFSLTVILLSTFARMADAENSDAVLQNNQVNRYSGMTTSLPSSTHLKK